MRIYLSRKRIAAYRELIDLRGDQQVPRACGHVARWYQAASARFSAGA